MSPPRYTDAACHVPELDTGNEFYRARAYRHCIAALDEAAAALKARRFEPEFVNEIKGLRERLEDKRRDLLLPGEPND